MASNKHKLTKEQLKEMSLTNLLGAYVLGGLAVAALVGYLVVQPLIINAQEDKREREQVNFDIESLEMLIADTEELRNNYEEVRDYRDQIIGLLPEDNEEEYMVAAVEEAANQSGVQFRNFQPELINETAEGGNYHVYNAELDFSGNNEQVADFLHNLEHNSRFMEVISVTADAGSQQDITDPLITASVQLVAYFQPAELNEAPVIQNGSSDENLETNEAE